MNRATVAIGAVATTAALVAGGCAADTDEAASPPSATEAACAPAPAPDTTTAGGWLGWIDAHPDDVALTVDDGTGTVVEHRSDEAQPIASAVKVVHLAAYARAVADGSLDPNEAVPVADWERWYLPGTDGAAHEHALARLEVTPDGTATLEQMVTAMIRESDNAVPDYLRDRLGDDALVDAADAGGWSGFTPTSKLGDAIALLDPAADSDRWAAAQRYASDPAYRAQIQALPLPDLAEQMAWASTTDAASPEQLAAMHRAIADGSFGAGTDVGRSQLEWQPPPPGLTAVGFKSGYLPGVLADAMYLRRPDGTVATAVLLTDDMAESDWIAALTALPQQQVLIAAMTDPDAAARLACVA